MLKQKLKNLLKRYGYAIYDIRRLPFGYDLKQDISRISPNLTLTTIFDVGANKGQTALDYLQKFPEAKIFSFEPVSETFEVLKNNLYSAPNVLCFNLALGEQNDQKQMLVEGTSGCNSILNTTDFNSKSNQSLESIKVMTLDSFLENYDNEIHQIDLLKIDTEGYESQVLRGAKATLSSNKILYILAEVTFRDQDRHHTQFSALNDILKEYNFNVVAFYDVRPYWGGGNAIDYCNVLFKRWEKGKSLKLWEN